MHVTCHFVFVAMGRVRTIRKRSAFDRKNDSTDRTNRVFPRSHQEHETRVRRYCQRPFDLRGITRHEKSCSVDQRVPQQCIPITIANQENDSDMDIDSLAGAMDYFLDEEVEEEENIRTYTKPYYVPGETQKIIDRNFEACQQYFLTVHSAAKTETQDDSRKIAAAGITPSKGKGKGRNQKKSKKKKDRVHAGHYDADEWADLTEDERKQVLALRKERKEKRKLGSVTTDNSSNASSKRSKTSHGSNAEDAISIDIDEDDAKPEAKTNVSVIMEVDESLLDSSVDNVPPPDKHSKFRASASPAKSSEDDAQPAKSSAGNSFGRFAH